MATSGPSLTRVGGGFLPPIALDPSHPGPIYRQLYDWFQRAIVEGRLRPGQRVPSTRGLANELKVSRIPVLTAYEQLHAEGYLETFTGSGTCVAASIPQEGFGFKPPKSPRAIGQKRAARVSRRLEASILAPLDPMLPSGGAFSVCSPALDQFPRDIWSSLLSRHARSPSRELMAYGDPMGYRPFREAIAEYLGATRGVRCDASQVMVVAGSQHGLQIAARALLDDNDPVWVEEPGYPRARRALVMAGAKPVGVPIDQEGLMVEAGVRRCKDARAAYITPSHQYPMGMTMSATRRMQLLNWATQAGSWIIEDDYNSEYRFGGHPVASLQGLGPDERVIYLGTLSKVLFPALRVGYLIIPKALVNAFCLTRDAMDIFPPVLFQRALTDFIRDGHFARHIRRMRMLYMERRQLLIAAIQATIGTQMRIISADAGMHLVGLLPTGMDDAVVARKAAEKGLSVTPLSACYLEPPARGGLILGYGDADRQEIESGVRRLKEILRNTAVRRNEQGRKN